MNILDCFLYFLDGYRKFFSFKGRATRSAFFSYIFITILIYFGLYFLVFVALDSSPYSFLFYLFLTTPLDLIVLIPTLAYFSRRLHDSGRSGWWLLMPQTFVFLLLIPFFPLLFDPGMWSPTRSLMFDVDANLNQSTPLLENLEGLIYLGLSLTAFLFAVFGFTLMPSDGDNKYGNAEDAVGVSLLLKIRKRKNQKQP